MRLWVTAGLGVCAAAAAGVWLAPQALWPGAGSPVTPKPHAGAASVGAAQVGARRLLDLGRPLRFRMVVLQPTEAADRVAFRAQALSDDGALPAYGRLRAVCDDGLDQATCWRFEFLEVDGAEIDVAALQGGPALRVVPAIETRRADGARLTETPLMRGLSDAAPAAAEPAIADSPQRAAATALADEVTAALTTASHQVRADRVNGRSGPGAAFEVLAVFNRGDRLRLLPGAENVDGWGRFQIIDGGDAGAASGARRPERVWISLDLVQPTDAGQ